MTIRVPVTITGTPPVTAFEPLLLASALEVGPVLRLIDHMSPLLASGPGGVFCVLMPMRCDAASIPASVAVPQPQPQPETPAARAVAA